MSVKDTDAVSHSYAIAKEIIINYFSRLRASPLEAVPMYQQDATLIWSIISKNTESDEGIIDKQIFGKHSIHQFFKTIPEFFFEVTSYDCQTIVLQNRPNLTILVTSGNVYPVEQQTNTEPFRFTSTFHIQMIEKEQRAAICYQTMNLFTSPI